MPTAVLPFFSFLFTPFLFLQKTFAEPHLCPLLWFHGWRKQNLKIILPTEEPPWQKYLIPWSFGPHSGTVRLQYDMPRVCGQGLPLSPDFLPLSSTSWRSHYSQECHKPGTRLLTSKPSRFLGLNHNVHLPTCLSWVQVHCLPSEALRFYSFVCGLILDG